MIWEYPSSTLIIYFTVRLPSIIHPEEITVKVFFGFCITKYSAFSVLEVIFLLVIISLSLFDYRTRSSSVGAHGWQNVSLYNYLGWSFILSIWRTVSSNEYLFHSMIYHNIDPGVGFPEILCQGNWAHKISDEMELVANDSVAVMLQIYEVYTLLSLLW